MHAATPPPRTRPITWLLAALLVTFVFAPPARGAQAPAAVARCPAPPPDPVRAKSLARAWYFYGHRLIKGRYPIHALNAFLCANRILPARAAIYWAGRSAELAGRKTLAAGLYLRILGQPPTGVTGDELRGRIARLRPKPAARPNTPPAAHPTTPSGRPGGPPVPERLRFRPADPEKGPRPGAGVPSVTIPPPAPGGTGTPKRSSPRTAPAVSRRMQMTDAGLTLAVLSGILMGVAITVGAVMDYNKRKIEQADSGAYWEPELKDRYDRFKRLQAGMWFSFGLGLAAGATSAILYLTRPKKKEKPERRSRFLISPTPGGAVAGFRNRF